ncbi:putative adenylyl cyclase CyaB [candidate division TM7 genomosp. GTL1]|nr:putative adenylyl cyclase CyaB [candidate division TM7 genomosp. GTL1]
MKHTEVEQKFHLLNHDELRERLQAAGAQQVRTQRQVDVYYNAPHRDFLADNSLSEWLRLCDEDGKVSITYKNWLPHDAIEKTHCDEYESGLTDGEAMRKLFAALQFTELITVDKEREEWKLGDIEVALDTVKDLGSFVEFEYKGDARTVEEAHRKIEACIKKLGAKLGDSHTGYPHKLIQKYKAQRPRG